MKYPRIASLFLCFLILFASVSLFQIMAVPIISDGFESNDFTAWSGTTGSPATEGTTVHAGSFAMQAAMTGVNYCYKTINNNEVYARAYIRFSALSANAAWTQLVLSLWNSGVGGQVAGLVNCPSNDNVHFYWAVKNLISGTTNTSSVPAVAGVWDCVEIGVLEGNASGWLKIWVNGTLAATINVDTSTWPNSTQAQFGTVNGGYANTVYLDDAVVDTSYIGPIISLYFTDNITSVANAKIGKIISVSLSSIRFVSKQVPRSAGYIVYASSGSASDIQDAVNSLSVTGGTVYIPAGTYTFNIDQVTVRLNNGRAGVQIPGGINVVGAGVGLTTLNIPLTGWDNDGSTGLTNTAFIGDGTNGLPIRLSGFTLNGSVNDTVGTNDDKLLTGTSFYGVKDFRIDNINFNDFPNTGVMASNNYINSALGNCGVIDHCNFDNPYKETFYNHTGVLPYWAYGVIVNGDGSKPWEPDWSTYFGQYGHDITFIEDCTFDNCRHSVAASQFGYYVLRYSTMTDMIVSGYGSYQDCHGGSEGCEVYNCTITNIACDARSTNDPAYWGKLWGIGLYSRGGFALYYNNTINSFQDGDAVRLTNDQANSTLRTNGVWIFDNTYNNCPSQLSIVPNGFTLVQDTEYFLRAPTLIDDGFTYTAYTYPHPLATP